MALYHGIPFTTFKITPCAPLFLPFTTRGGHLHLHSSWKIHRRTTLTFSAKSWSGGKKKMPSRANLTDSDLCEELLNFIAVEGLPEGRVPSTAELSKRGRKDLANIVRRRGYKIISELLRNQTNESTHLEDGLSESESIVFGNGGINESLEAQVGSSDVSAETISGRVTSGDLSSLDNFFHRNNGVCIEINESSEPLVPPPCENPVQLTSNRGDALEVVKNQYPIKASGEETDYAFDNSRDFSSENKIDNSQSLVESGAGADSEITETGFASSVIPQFRNDATLGKFLKNEFDGDISPGDGATDKQTEIDNLRAMLQFKEMELLQLRQEIEKEKLALSTLQNKAAAEMDYIQNLISQKDAELSAAEESLLGLKEVLVEYQGHGETVEIAGSFNGWHHRIKMDRHSSVNLNSTEKRDDFCWRATLWLYPGTYEIKFIVDGHWKTDPHREFIRTGHITNNIIRVER